MLLSSLPFKGLCSVQDYFSCKPDIEKLERLEPLALRFGSIEFTDRILPPCQPLSVNLQFDGKYFLDLFSAVKAYGTNNYRGARIPLQHNNINVENFRAYLIKFQYPHIYLMQYVEFGFPLGLWADVILTPCQRNHSSSYSYYSYIDKFIDTEIAQVGLTGPFDDDPFNGIMISPLMTAPKKPAGRRAVFDASFGLNSLNKNTPEKEYHEADYEFHYPKIDDLADMIASLGNGCFLFKRDLSRFYLQLKVDPIEYDKLGFIWRKKLFFFVSFVWGCRHAGYCGQWLSSAISFIHAALGIDIKGSPFNILNYADDFAGAEASLDIATTSYNVLGQLLSELGIIESIKKACPPDTTMVYLGVKFDTINMAMYVDDEKIAELKLVLSLWCRKTVAKKQELQSILGKLLWVSRCVRFSRIFVSRIIAEIRKLPRQSAKTTLSLEIKKDFIWWNKYMETFSGVELIPPITVSQTILGDAYPQGGGSWNPVLKQYFSRRFPQYMCSPETPIHVKEFIVVILAIRLWGSNWAGQRIVIFCDNDAVCDALTYLKPSNSEMQKLVRECLLWICTFNFHPVMQKISSADNHLADMISRNHDEKDIKNYFSFHGYETVTEIKIPDDWFNYVADW